MKITVDVPDDRVANCLVSALEGGSRHWSTIKSYHKPKGALTFRLDKDQVFRHVDYPMSEGGAITINEFDEDRPRNDPGKDHRLDRAAIQRGLQVMAEQCPRHFAALVGENDDAETGDVLLQCALFGKIVYG